MKAESENNDKKISVRDKILLTAHDLFYSTGFRATGVDTLIKEAKVTKVTFYRHYPSKSLLILAYLHYRHEIWINWFEATLRRHLVEGRTLYRLPFMNGLFRLSFTAVRLLMPAPKPNPKRLKAK